MDQEQLEAVRRLLALVDRYHLAELVVEEAGVTVTIRGTAPAERTAEALRPLEEAEPWRDLVDSSEETGQEAYDGFHRLLSPMTGLFYRSPSPEARPYVEVGDFVEEGQTIGLIEAMKVYSEIPADVSGRVVRVLVENGALVTQGEPLLLLETETDAV